MISREFCIFSILLVLISIAQSTLLLFELFVVYCLELPKHSINGLISSVSGLECYVCENQEDNNEKCVKTIKTCDYGQDVCLTEIKWGTMPYWSQGAKKQYYISKRCSNKSECATTRQRNMPLCTHIWYQDWVCSDCCLGDRCNYYVIVSITIFNKGRVTVSQARTTI